MHLRLTDEDLTTILEMLSLSMWTCSFNRKPEAAPGIDRVDQLLQRLFSKATETDLRKHIDWNEERQGHCFTREYEEKSFFAQCYEEFRNENFWEEMVSRMAERDLVSKIGRPAYEALTDSKRQKLSEPLEKRYWDEMLKNGIENIHLVHPRNTG